jgi:hypothetical protein
VLLSLIKILLLWWIIATVVKWYRHLGSRGERKTDDNGSDVSGKRSEYPGRIVDAEFEEIDDKKRSPS